jgi:hypothetical protein
MPRRVSGAVIVARVLRAAFGTGLATVRAAGWRGPALALLSYVPLAIFGALPVGALLFVGMTLHVVVLLALIRLLAAGRTEPLPPAPQVDDEGRRVAPPTRPGPPLAPEDRGINTALRNAARLWRPAISVAALYLLAPFAAGLTAVALSGGKVAEYSPSAQAVAILPLSALATAFVALAPQRVALEGDNRVLVAAAHSVRVARTSYGVLLLLVAGEPLIAAAAILALPGEHPPAGRVVVVATLMVAAATVVKLVSTAVATEVYARAPRLDLPLDPAL